MDIMETLKKLVNTDEKMERMEIVEAFEMPENEEGGGDTSELETQLAELQATIGELQTSITEKDQKYIDTFFGGDDEKSEKKDEKKDEKKVEKKDDKKSLDDIEKENAPK